MLARQDRLWRWPGLGTRAGVPLGEHDFGQSQECIAGNLPCCAAQIRSALLIGIRISLQSSIQSGQCAAEIDLCSAAHATNAGKTAENWLSVGGNQEVICPL